MKRIILLCLFLSNIANADYFGPILVIKSSWGKGEGQLGRSGERFHTLLPTNIQISQKNFFYICDSVNWRFTIFNNNGFFIKNISWQGRNNSSIRTSKNVIVKYCIEKNGNIIALDVGGTIKKYNFNTGNIDFSIESKYEYNLEFFIDNDILIHRGVINNKKETRGYNISGGRFHGKISQRNKQQLISVDLSRAAHFMDRNRNIVIRNFPLFIRSKIHEKKINRISVAKKLGIQEAALSTLRLTLFGIDSKNRSFWSDSGKRILIFNENGLPLESVKISKNNEIHSRFLRTPY